MWAWEEMVEECRRLLNDVVLHADVSDRWQWGFDIDGGYTMSGVYHILTTQAKPPVVGMGDLVWHKQVLLKVSIFAWQLLRDRLPTKNNLLRRGLLNVEAARCVAGCSLDE